MLLRTNEGIPLGIMTAETSFADLKYFVSGKFWKGVLAIPGYGKYLVAIWIIVSGVIAALAGPATAVLIIPTSRPVWPAGSAYFNMAGDESVHYPSTLSESNDGGILCQSPSVAMLNSPSAFQLGCPWAGFAVLQSMYMQWGSDLAIYPGNSITFFEWEEAREIYQHTRALENTPESWATATLPAANVWSGSLHIAWRGAVANEAQLGPLSPAFNFHSWGSTTTHIPTLLPAVRTVCRYQNDSESISDLRVREIDRSCSVQTNDWVLLLVSLT